MSNRRKIPAPGLRGDYTSTCVGCLTPTDTAMAFRGEPEWLAAGLINLGIKDDVAAKMVETWPGYPDTDVWPVRVCADCATRAGFPAPRLAIPDVAIPVITQRGFTPHGAGAGEGGGSR